MRHGTIVLGLLLAAGVCGADAGRLRHRLLTDLLTRHDADRRDLEQYHVLPSAERTARLQALLAHSKAALADLRFEDLDGEGRIDYLLCERWLARQAERLAREEAWRTAALRGVLPLLDELVAIERLDRGAGGGWPLEQLAQRLTAIGAAADRLHAQWKPAAQQPPAGADGPLLRWSAERLDAAQRYLKGWYEANRDSAPGFRWWLEKPYARCHASLVRYRDLLRGPVLERLKREAGRNVFAVGRERFARALRQAYVPHTPESLLALGQQQFDAISAELLREARRIDATAARWQDVLPRIKQAVVPPGEQRGHIARVAREAIAFAGQHGLVRVPEGAARGWYLAQISAGAQKRFPFAYYSRLQMGVAYARGEMEQADKLAAMRGNNRYFTRTVVPHELIPGHHLQHWYAARHRAWRGRFSTPFLVEGWGLYCELLLDEHGFFRTPEERIGHLFWRLLRAARILVSTRYHLGQLGQPQMVEFLVQHVGLERQGAQAEVDRYMTYSPLYQAAYLTGALQLVELRSLCRERWGKQWSLVRFHDALLQQGPIPIRLMRYALTGDPVPYHVPLHPR